MGDNDLSTRGAKRSCLDSHRLSESDFSYFDSDTGELPIVVQAPTEPTFEHVKELWFEDGSIILASDVHLYRVHKSMLVKYSPVLRRMLVDSPSKETYSGTYSGVPIVKMTDDKDDAVFALLKALYNRK